MELFLRQQQKRDQKYLLFIFVLCSSCSSAQKIHLLEEKKEELLFRVSVLQDSLQTKEYQIQDFEEKNYNDDPAVSQVKGIKNNSLISSSLETAKPIINVEK